MFLLYKSKEKAYLCVVSSLFEYKSNGRWGRHKFLGGQCKIALWPDLGHRSRVLCLHPLLPPHRKSHLRHRTSKPLKQWAGYVFRFLVTSNPNEFYMVIDFEETQEEGP